MRGEPTAPRGDSGRKKKGENQHPRWALHRPVSELEIHLVSPSILMSHRHPWSHFTEEETGPGRYRELPKVTKAGKWQSLQYGALSYTHMGGGW